MERMNISEVYDAKGFGRKLNPCDLPFVDGSGVELPRCPYKAGPTNVCDFGIPSIRDRLENPELTGHPTDGLRRGKDGEAQCPLGNTPITILTQP